MILLALISGFLGCVTGTVALLYVQYRSRRLSRMLANHDERLSRLEAELPVPGAI